MGVRSLAQLLEGAHLKLPHSLEREPKRLADLLERVIFLATEPVATAKDELLAWGESAHQPSDTWTQAIPIDVAFQHRSRRIGDEVLKAFLCACRG